MSAPAQIRLPAPNGVYDQRNEAEARRQLEILLAKQQAEIAELVRRLKAAGIP